jgi:hypothetical protein
MRIARSALVAIALLLGFTSLAGAPAASAAGRSTTVTITHAALTPTSVQGSGLGTVRTFYVPTKARGRAVPGTGAVPGYLAGTLTTIAVGLDGNRELRAANLVFVVGSEANQLVVGGVSSYPSDGSTLAVGQRTVRPIIGGSGVFDGARGSVVSTNLGAQGWRHVFRILR